MLEYFWPLFGKDKNKGYLPWTADREAQAGTVFFGTILLICYTPISRILVQILAIIRIIINDIAIFIQNKQIDNEDS